MKEKILKPFKYFFSPKSSLKETLLHTLIISSVLLVVSISIFGAMKIYATTLPEEPKKELNLEKFFTLNYYKNKNISLEYNYKEIARTFNFKATIVDKQKKYKKGDIVKVQVTYDKDFLEDCNMYCTRDYFEYRVN